MFILDSTKGVRNMSKTMNEVFSSNLRNALYMAGKTQAELAKATGVSEVSVSKWVNGIVVPRPAMLDKICACLKCRREDLMVDRSKQVFLAPEDVLADEMRERPELYNVFNALLQMHSSDVELIYDMCKRLLK